MILLLGGTIDSRKIARILTQEGIEFITSTVSDYGKDLASKDSDHVINKAMDAEELMDFIKENKVKTLLDASHPFAENASLNAISASRQQGIRYIRYERPEEKEANDRIIYVKDLDGAAQMALEHGENILLTIGSRGLMAFKEVAKRRRLIARVLPEEESIRACKEAGISPGNIIAMQGPFSHEFNKLIIKEKEIDLLVSKSSGREGGLDHKLKAALESGCKVIIIERPGIEYPFLFNDIDKTIEILKEEL